MPQTNQILPPDSAAIVVYIGIDWADREHAYHLLDNQGAMHAARFRQQPEEIQRQVEAWRKAYPGARFQIAIEQSRGALINALMQFEDVDIFPVNPAKLASYRKSFAHGGGKNDPVDARLLAQFLQNYHHELRPLRCDQPVTRELAALTEHRRGFVNQRTKLANQLTAALKGYFPTALALEPCHVYADFFLRFLIKYSTLDAAQRAGRSRLRKFLHGAGAKRKVEERLDILLNAKPLTEDPILLCISARRILPIVQQIKVLNLAIKAYDVDISRRVVAHHDYVVVASLPGAGKTTQARILAALGDDRTRYQTTTALQAAAGIAPIITQSGRQKTVSCRWACTKFVRQTFHEFAGTSIAKCAWAHAFYDLQLSRGKSEHTARRSLAYKWIRIIYRCWQNGVAYDETRYLQCLRATKSPLLPFLDQPAKQPRRKSKTVDHKTPLALGN